MSDESPSLRSGAPALEGHPWLAPTLAGLAPVLAVTTRLDAALLMGVALFVLAAAASLSGALARRYLPARAASLATVVAVAAAIAGLEATAGTVAGVRESLGIYLPAAALTVLAIGTGADGSAGSAAGAAGRTGGGYLAGLAVAAAAREILGAGTLTLPGLGAVLSVPGLASHPAAAILAPAGGLIVAGYLVAVARALARGRPPAPSTGREGGGRS